LNLQKRFPLVVGILVIAWVLVLLSKASRVVPHSAPTPSRTETSIGTVPPAPSEPSFTTYDEAVQYVRGHYSGESIDARRSSWITSAEYFPADGRGYLILGMTGRPYIFAGVPLQVWQEFKDAPSLGRYYNQNIRGRYRLNLQ
jgi:hypothetical protein